MSIWTKNKHEKARNIQLEEIVQKRVTCQNPLKIVAVQVFKGSRREDTLKLRRQDDGGGGGFDKNVCVEGRDGFITSCKRKEKQRHTNKFSFQTA